MPDLTLVILSAGNSTRFAQNVKKQWLRIGEKPLWQFVTDSLKERMDIADVIVTAHPDEAAYMRKHGPYTIIEGGASRQESLQKALTYVKTPYLLVTDVARACVPDTMLQSIVEAKERADIVVPYLPVPDTVVYRNETIDRDEVRLIQTPQLSRTETLRKALDSHRLYTDDSSAVRAIGGSVYYIKGSTNAKKITVFDDLEALPCLKAQAERVKTGIGFYVHRFCRDREMALGGIPVKSEFGFEAHSDGDVALHALIDALLGAIGAGDIGERYPDTDMANKDIDSKKMLAEVVRFVTATGHEIQNVDITVMAQTPKLSPYKDRMREKISEITGIAPIDVNIKATTTERLGFVGRKEGVAVEAVATVKYYNWKRI
ncbi:MAG TPA: bifunctional 2-C-methyl-D-erythritol 4-phosphate cytidylyltransferase/2-C-methyl-D-erythritol 2,4-cyclodiphosphate synthase [Campylobacteraceae bacterium]|nr:bifunctional 2-C-methyl-D-erythritol 4-phosphate cytidylyltransferase/2-C-methyl-D-erythritol 2,4-cyclodiphosphate synthase [Campylobacteraceae bacterium]